MMFPQGVSCVQYYGFLKGSEERATFAVSLVSDSLEGWISPGNRRQRHQGSKVLTLLFICDVRRPQYDRLYLFHI